MTAILDPPLLTLAFCWRLERRDGICVGFTTHDRPLTIGGLTYRAAPGMLPSAIGIESGFGAAALDVSGALTSNAISQGDLEAGRWDGASVEIFVADWSDAGAAVLPFVRGELGEVKTRRGAFDAELRGPGALLDAPAVEQTSPECRAEFGDRRCRVDLAGRVRLAQIAAVAGSLEVEVDGPAAADGFYSAGRIRWLSGPNSALARGIVGSEGNRLFLDEPPSHPAAVGDRVEVREGCDKRFATCAARFANAENFRGEPHLPGMDLLTRYPGAS